LSSYNGALSTYDEVLALRPNCITALYNKAFILNLRGDVDSAINTYDSLLQLDPDNPSALYNKRFALYRVGGSSNEAETLKAQLDTVDPGFEAALDNRGTKIFLPEEYRTDLGYKLPTRWYEEETTAANTTMAEDQAGTPPVGTLGGRFTPR
jgi:tetratricopeptide (TPR) repeat protein